MKEFEYKIETVRDPNDESHLNIMGAKGWELVSVNFQLMGLSTLYWKREIR